MKKNSVRIQWLNENPPQTPPPGKPENPGEKKEAPEIPNIPPEKPEIPSENPGTTPNGPQKEVPSSPPQGPSAKFS